ncbi:hypothetical protein KIN20_017898 [Parelaphostrongylus tenuis]|uniref:Uncharacterized protein n=1 Tax=Parelaphostrongylus tenuis TaxID=148309 RepID=A0AAD5N1C7_PARTN|nr:hypothetical protein KIN20_017898 [Parelaphostrongylus tenuis]
MGPLAVFDDVIAVLFRAGVLAVDQIALPRPSLGVRENEKELQLITSREPSPKRPKTEQDADGHRRTEQAQVRVNVPDVAQGSELGRKWFQVYVKALQQDYSSLLKTKEELFVNVRELRRLTALQFRAASTALSSICWK